MEKVRVGIGTSLGLNGSVMLLTPMKGMLAIDLEFSCVAAAINDLAYSFMWIEKKERRRIFLKAYLEAAGFSAATAETEDLGRGFWSINWSLSK